MVGLPRNCQTRQDWINAVTYAEQHPQHKAALRLRLNGLAQSKTMKVLKADAPSDPEEQTPEHFEDVIDPASPFAASGLSEAEISDMLRRMEE